MQRRARVELSERMTVENRMRDDGGDGGERKLEERTDDGEIQTSEEKTRRRRPYRRRGRNELTAPRLSYPRELGRTRTILF